MEDKTFEYLYNFEESYWWYKARRGLIKNLILKHSKFNSNKNILDIGCSTAGNAELIGKNNHYIGLDLSQKALKLAKKRHNNISLVNANALYLPFKSKSFKCVLMLDVLEHLDEDLNALKEAYRLIKKDGLIIISVPALRLLWRDMDEIGHHKRRYNKAELIKKIGKSKLKIIEIDYWGKIFLIPLLTYTFIKKLFKKKPTLEAELRTLSNSMNNFLINIMRLENIFFNRINFWGSSLICICKKS